MEGCGPHPYRPAYGWCGLWVCGQNHGSRWHVTGRLFAPIVVCGGKLPILTNVWCACGRWLYEGNWVVYTVNGALVCGRAGRGIGCWCCDGMKFPCGVAWCGFGRRCMHERNHGSWSALLQVVRGSDQLGLLHRDQAYVPYCA